MTVKSNLKRITRWMTFLISLVIVIVSVIVFDSVVSQIELSDQDYALEESQLMKISEEINRNVDYYIENEKSLFERNVNNELFYLVSYIEVKYKEEEKNLNSFLHYKELEDIMMIEGDQIFDFNPEKYFAEDMESDEISYLIATLSNNIGIKNEGSFYYYWPKKNSSYKLDRKVVYYHDSGKGYVMTILFETEAYNEIIKKQVKEWLESVYSDEVLIYDLESGAIINNDIIDNFNITRVSPESISESSFYYEQNGSTTRIINLSRVSDLDVIIGNQILVTDYGGVIKKTLSNGKVLWTIIFGISLIIIIKLLEYYFINRIVESKYFDKRFVYETLEFCDDGVAVIDGNYVIEDCNDKFKGLLGLDVFIKDTYNLKKMIPEFIINKSQYNLLFMNKKSVYIDGDVIIKRIENKYIVKIKKNEYQDSLSSLSFKEFKDAVMKRFSDVEGFIENRLFVMTTIENGIKIDYLVNKIKNHFSIQGVIAIAGHIGNEERIIYLEGVSEEIFDNTFENILNSGVFDQCKNSHYSCVLVKKNEKQLDINYIMEELDFKLYEKKKKQN
ncbi:MAG: hypothetical protein JW702_04380 [Clostridiales bacterium]|nr:hypothetical protein [Clostridiales bacterium]